MVQGENRLLSIADFLFVCGVGGGGGGGGACACVRVCISFKVVVFSDDVP